MEGGPNDVLSDIIADNFHLDMQERPFRLSEVCCVEMHGAESAAGKDKDVLLDRAEDTRWIRPHID